ncbi:hypothetical protein BOW35_07685 [Solemya velum gill symbiont]|nr:hypothetical protein BOW27_04200 [Solemya velum gill symbiont]OOZ19980.1 hypothetical protein BOW29_04200 [Solemya velum gill symbiont]OOZ22777.1 hypothetical protein BOW30_04525 [Solemya velum gill symbiont]OOZ24965.1 hypothetical protein BOW31_03995 [Solemya velum gill symbiont]OOZ29806.1 hypothetical protein BOW33_03855 [Solemya velum gill symbiont]
MVIATTAILAVLLPPVGVLSAAAVALVVMANGVRESLFVVAIALLAVWGLGEFILQAGVVVGISALVLWLPMILLGGLQRWSQYLPWSVEAALLVALVALGLQYVVFDDPVAYWSELLLPVIEEIAKGGAFEESGGTAESVVADIAQVLPTMLTVGFFLQLVIALFIGRWWHSLLYNPGGFREEFYSLRLSRILALAVIPLMLVGIISSEAMMLDGVVMLVMAAFVIQGLAVAHASLNGMNAGGWLIAVYVLLLFAGPWMLMLLGFAGYADVWMDFRQRFLNKQD